MPRHLGGGLHRFPDQADGVLIVLTHQATLDNAVHDGRAAVASPSPRLPGAWIVNDWNPPADPLWQRILTEVAGVNLYGDPLLRIVNGSSRLELVGGVWSNVEYEDAGLPSVRYQWDQRYPWLEEFWIVEEWVPVNVSREAWERAERQHEDGASFLAHPLYPSRGEYRYFNHFRQKTKDEDGEDLELPELPTPTGLRILAGAWRLRRSKYPPPTLEADAAERARRLQGNARAAAERRARRERENRRIKRDIWENEVGGPTGITPKVSLAGLTVPKD